MRRATSAGVNDTLDGSRQRCQKLHSFIREAWHILVPESPFLDNWHIHLLCTHLEAVSRGLILAQGLENRLLFNVPPGTMKSLTMVFWTAWEWGPLGRPHLQTIATSYRNDFTLRDSRKFRHLVSSQWYQDRWKVNLISIGEHRVENDRGSWRQAIPFGSLTGGRGDRLIIDDPHSVDTAESDADRERTTIRFRESALLRLNDPMSSAIVVIMQRLHMQDVSGVILQEKMPFIHVMLPMRFEPERRCITPFGEDPRTTEGELLFSTRFPMTVIERDEAGMGVRTAAGQMQQRPTPRGGLLFQRSWFKIVPAVPANCSRVRAWDFASSVKSSAAWTVGLKLAHDRVQKQFYIEDVIRTRVENPEPLVTQTALLDGKAVAVSVPQDPGQAAKIQVRSIVGALAGWNAVSSPEPGEKEVRAMPVAAQAQAGNVHIVQGAWNTAFLDELETFPTGYKDQVDALSRAFAHVLQFGSGVVVVPLIVSEPRTYFGDHPGYG